MFDSFDTQVQIEELINFINYLDQCTEQDKKDYDDILSRHRY